MRWEVAGSTEMLTLYFSKSALSDFLDDGVFAELRWRVGHLLFRGDGHCGHGGEREGCGEERVGEGL